MWNRKMEKDWSNSSKEASLRFLSPTLSASYQISIFVFHGHKCSLFFIDICIVCLYLPLQQFFCLIQRRQSIRVRFQKSFIIIIFFNIVLFNIVLTWKIVKVLKVSVIYIYIYIYIQIDYKKITNPICIYIISKSENYDTKLYLMNFFSEYKIILSQLYLIIISLRI